MVGVQWDELYVRILDPKTGQLLREHVRQKRGWYRIQEQDHPKQRSLRVSQLLWRAGRAGTHIGTFCNLLCSQLGEPGVRRVLGVLSLAKKFSIAAVEDACAAALEMGVHEYRFVRRYLERGPQLFFASYQGTRQVNGTAAGQSRIACTANLNEPPLTNDRSPTALGKLFSDLKGALGGIAINPDGSNINPVALALLNFKLPDGSFLIPTPQTVDTSRPFASSGFSAFTQPCTFNEDQGLGNVDYLISQKSRLAARFFIADTEQSVTFPGGALNPVGNIRGFDSPGGSDFTVFSVAHAYALSNALLNEARIGFVRSRTGSGAEAPFKWSDVGVSESEMNQNNELPSLNILGSVSMASVIPRTYKQNSFVFSDVVSFLKGSHAVKFGGSVTRLQDNLEFVGAGSFVQFLSWPDFLLGLDASGNGTGTFSNVFSSFDIFGLLNREFRVWEGSGFVQDDYRIRRSLTLNLGLRYERLGQFGDNLGRNSSFDVNKANANPPPTGSLDGYIVASNFPDALPTGVTRVDNTFGTYGEGQDTIAPRMGFAWQFCQRQIGWCCEEGTVCTTLGQPVIPLLNPCSQRRFPSPEYVRD